jgi:hypothetical protein
MSRRKKKNADKKNGADLLREWQRERLLRDRELPRPATGPSEVTLLAYHFRPESQEEERFPFLECAIRESWRQCGFLHTVVVTHSASPALRAFAEPYGIHFEIQEEKSLVPGRPETMAADMLLRLHERFATPFVLVVQDDAFPLRPGLGSFLDDWDFCGAPLLRDHWWTNLLARYTNGHAMDGAFSLRTRALCERAAAEWAARGGRREPARGLAENLVYTRTLPRSVLSYRIAARFPSSREALRFSYAGTGPFTGGIPPFGFHGAAAFKALSAAGKIL